MKKIYIILKKKGITQNRLSEMTGLSTPVISQICTGRIKPSAKEIRWIRDAVGCDISDITEDA